ncbi:MAG: hypothetical protein ACKODH_00880 [Limisphaerales bacterium]
MDGETVEEVLGKVCSGSITAPIELAGPDTVARIESGIAVPAAHAGGALQHCPDGQIPAALSAVAMKALRRDRGQRYQSVTELAKDIEAYQTGFATSAEEAGALTLIRLFILRHRTLAAAASLIVLLTIGFLFKLFQSERKATRNAELATANAQTAKTNEERAEAHAKESQTNAAKALAEAVRASATERVALTETEATRKALARANLALAEAAFREHDGAAMRAALREVPEDLRDLNYAYLAPRSDTSLATLRTRASGHISGVAAHPRRPGIFAIAGDDHQVTLMEARTGRPLTSFPIGLGNNYGRGYLLAFSPDGSRLAVANRSGTKIAIFRGDSGERLAEWATVPPEAIEFNRDGTRLLVVPLQRSLKLNETESLRVHETLTGRQVWAHNAGSAWIRACFVSSGEAVLAVFSERTLKLLDAQDGREVRALPDSRHFVHCIAISPDGQFALLGDEQGGVRKLRLADGQVVLDFRAAEFIVRSLAFTPDGQRFAALVVPANQTYRRVQLRDAGTGAPLLALSGVEGTPDRIKVHPLSAEMIVAGPVTKCWDVFQLPAKWIFPATVNDPWAGFWGRDDWVLFPNPTGSFVVQQLASAGSAEIWISGRETIGKRVTVSADGRRVLTGGAEVPCKLFERDGTTVKELATWSSRRALPWTQLDAGGQRLLAGQTIFDAATGAELARLALGNLASRTGTWVGSKHVVLEGYQDARNYLNLFEASSGKRLLSTLTPNTRIMSLAGAPDGSTLAEVGQDKLVRIRDRDTAPPSIFSMVMAVRATPKPPSASRSKTSSPTNSM